MRDQSSTVVHRFSTALCGIWTALWLAANLAWLRSDRLVRDGDEEGHVGAAELFREDLNGGQLLAFFERTFVADMGDYPSLYPATLGAWWWATGADEPGVPVVRAVGLLWVLLAALATARLASRSGRPGAAPLAFLATTLLPLPVGLARHFMPEGMLVAAVALALWAAVRFGERASLGRGLVLGLAIGLGVLVKQTFLPLALPGLIAIGLHHRPPLRGLLAPAFLATSIAGPWTFTRLSAQLAYGMDSVTATGEGEPWAHLLFYPTALLLLVVGLPLVLAALPALRRSAAGPVRTLALAWLLGGLLVLTPLPKKYPRLAAPLAPAVALLVGVGLAGPSGPAAGVGIALLGGAWLGWRSLSPGLALPDAIQQVVPGCPQHWLRAPVDDDLGIGAVVDRLAQLGPGMVRVIDEPEVPCELQTSPPWSEHLKPALRRQGQEREVRVGPGPERAMFELRWHAQPDPSTAPAATAQTVPVPRLGGYFTLHRSPK